MKKLLCLLLCLAFISFCGCNNSSHINSSSPSLDSLPAGSDNFVYIDSEEYSKPYCRDALTAEQKRLYSIIFDAVTEMKSEDIDLGKCSQRFQSDVALAYRAIGCDNPQMFWLPLGYELTVSIDGEVKMSFSYDEHKYPVEEETRDEMRLSLEHRVDEICDMASELPNKFEKLVYIHDYITDNTSYNEAALDENALEHAISFTAYGALMNGSAVCEGYSKALQLLCEALEIPCALIYGESKDLSHVWNAVRLGDDWCYIDSTWNDHEQFGTTHLYFNVTEEQLCRDHEIYPVFNPFLEYTGSDEFNFLNFSCKNENYNFFRLKDRIIKDDYELVADALSKEKQSGSKRVEFLISNKDIKAVSSLKIRSAIAGKIEIKDIHYIDDVVLIIL